MIRALLTGFEPFGGDATNPSGLAVRRVAASWNGPAELITAVLPVAFADAAEAVRGLIDEHAPDVVIATGLACGRAAVTPERVAINLMDARIRDNTGERPIDKPVAAAGPAAYFTTLPVKAIARDIRAGGIASDVSFTAGTFVCNQVFYAVMHHTVALSGVKAGFIHVPWSREHAPAEAPALAMDDIARALEIAVRISIRDDREVAIPGGTLS